MKKIALVSLMCCIGGTYALPVLAGTCGAKSIDIAGFFGATNQSPTDDEFLYTDSSDQKKAQKDYNGTGSYKINSYALECDNDYCGIHTVVYLPDGGIAGTTKGKYFMCDMSAVDDKWVPIKECPDGQEIRKPYHDFYVARKNSVQKGNNMTDYKIYDTYSAAFPCVCSGEVYDHDGKQYCRVGNGKKTTPTPKSIPTPTPTPTPTPKTAPTPAIGGCVEIDGVTKVARGKTSVHQVCQVKALSDAGAEQCVCMCTDNDTWRCDVTSCKGDTHGHNYNWIENETNVSGGKGVCKEAKKGTTVTKSCKDSRKTQTGKACCDVPKTQAEYDAKTDSCNCLDKNAEFKIINNKGQCVAKEVTPVVDGECEYLIKAGIKCANGNYYLEEGWQKVKKSDFEGKSCAEIKQTLDNDVNRLITVFKDLCKPVNDLVIMDDGKVEDAQKVLSAFTASATEEASVWKTSEGKFNTTRLASDITAGVVLGTVGGVVTGNVIKKNQVKKGFEALHCTVGGQKVADWGDEFNVGLRR